MARVIGLDIGSFSLKALSLSKKGKGYRLERIGIALNPIGDLPGDDEPSQDKIAEVVKKLLSDIRLSGSKATIALSESQVYSRVIEMPVLSDSELASAIHWEAEQYIPVPIDQVNIDHEIIFRPKRGSDTDKMQIFLVAAPKKVIQRVVTFANKCGVEVVGLETEMIAVARSMVNQDMINDSTMLLHYGAKSADIAVIRDGMPVLMHTIESGGIALTRTLSNELGLEFSQAEEYKRSYGLDTSQLEGKVSASLMPLIDRLLSEVRKALHAYNSANQQSMIKRVILSGGSSLLPGLVSHIAQFLGIEVVLGNAFFNVEPSKTASIPSDRVSFATAAGLAMREL
jgi:type IV pilus assembly protein PilM